MISTGCDGRGGTPGAPVEVPDRSDWPALATFSDEIDEWLRAFYVESARRFNRKQAFIAERIARREMKAAA